MFSTSFLDGFLVPLPMHDKRHELSEAMYWLLIPGVPQA